MKQCCKISTSVQCKFVKTSNSAVQTFGKNSEAILQLCRYGNVMTMMKKIFENNDIVRLFRFQGYQHSNARTLAKPHYIVHNTCLDDF
jgi:uncharacterized membrane protein YjjP (DUF1212 family)